MEYMKIEGLEEKVSRIIMGTAWMTKKREGIDEVIEGYIKAGGNVLDTGRFYMGGEAETYLKDWVKRNPKLRQQVLFISKACHHYVDENNIHHPEKNRVQPEYITEDLEYSLNNLGLDHFDIFMLHRDNKSVPVAVLMDRLEQHYQEGKIKVYGVSNWSLDRIKEAQDYCKKNNYQGIRVNSPSYSLAEVHNPRWAGTVYADDDYARWNTEHDITILSWGAQGNGFFGKVPFDDGSVTKDYKDAFYHERNWEKKKRAEELAKKKGSKFSAINIALAYVLKQDHRIAGIVGPRNTEELASTLQAEQVALTKEELDYLRLEY